MLLVALATFSVAPQAAISAPFDFPVSQVRQGEWRPSIATQGLVTAAQEVVLSLPFESLVKTVPINAGQAVKRGEVLAQIDASPLTRLLLSLQAADEKLDLAKQHLSIIEHQFNAKLATRDDRLQAKQSLISATSDLKDRWLTVNNALLQMREAVIESALLKQLKNTTADVVAEQHSKILAPFDGIVAQRRVGPGTQIASGQPLFVVNDMSHIYVSLLIPPSQLDTWKGGEASAKRYGGGKVPLNLLSKEPSIDPATGLIGLKFEADNPQGRFLDGAWISVTLEEKPLPVLWVPESAVVERNGKQFCVRRQNRGYESVEVEAGSPSDGRIPIISGLQPDDKVVVQNAYLLLYRDLKDKLKRAAD